MLKHGFMIAEPLAASNQGDLEICQPPVAGENSGGTRGLPRACQGAWRGAEGGFLGKLPKNPGPKARVAVRKGQIAKRGENNFLKPIDKVGKWCYCITNLNGRQAKRKEEPR